MYKNNKVNIMLNLNFFYTLSKTNIGILAIEICNFIWQLINVNKNFGKEEIPYENPEVEKICGDK
ncbi:MAG: hypothetical protein GY795_27045 [Desulfobacterales bacterium]|nr:hypothetical protein [Desulfobacterales bacterium]